MIWFTADTHFGHAAVINYCNRPWATAEEMNEGLIERWNSRVSKGHKVYVLGDFCFGGTKRITNIVSKLNGYKILVRGNHDPKAHKMLAAGFDQVLENERIKLSDGTRVYVSHFPYHPGTDENQDRRYLHKRIVDDAESYLLHGHVHTDWAIKGRMINVGVDMWDWYPLHESFISEIIHTY